jgi:hypothetical protein
MMEMVFVDRLGVRMHLEEQPVCAPDERYTLVIEEEQELRDAPGLWRRRTQIDDAPWPPSHPT